MWKACWIHLLDPQPSERLPWSKVLINRLKALCVPITFYFHSAWLTKISLCASRQRRPANQAGIACSFRKRQQEMGENEEEERKKLHSKSTKSDLEFLFGHQCSIHGSRFHILQVGWTMWYCYWPSYDLIWSSWLKRLSFGSIAHQIPQCNTVSIWLRTSLTKRR